MIGWVDNNPYEATCVVGGHELGIRMIEEDGESTYWTMDCKWYNIHNKLYTSSRVHAKEMAIRSLSITLVERIACDSQLLQSLTQED